MGLFGVKGFSNWNGVMYLGMDIAPGLAWDAIPPPRVGYLPPPCSAAATATLAQEPPTTLRPLASTTSQPQTCNTST